MTCINCNAEILNNSIYCNYCGSKQVNTKRHKKNRGNGQGTVYRLPNGKWRAEVTLCHKIIDGELIRKRRTKSTFSTKKEAENYLPYLKYNEKQQVVNYTLFEVHIYWLKTKKYNQLSESKKTHYRTAWSRIKSLWYYNISNITLEDMQACVDKLETGYYPKRDIKALLNHLINYAMKNEWIEKNRVKWIELPELKKSKKDAFNSNEILNIWNDYFMGNEISNYALIMIYTGLRPGELFKIKSDNIFLNEKYMIGGIKSDAGINRVIPLLDDILPVVKKSINNHGLIDMKADTFYEKWGQMISRTKIRPLNPHCCRHTCATMLAEKGVQPAIITEILGHADYETTLGYTHISLQSKLVAINKLSQKNPVEV